MNGEHPLQREHADPIRAIYRLLTERGWDLEHETECSMTFRSPDERMVLLVEWEED